MAFSDFQTVEQVLRHHPLLVAQARFLPAARLAPPDWFLENSISDPPKVLGSVDFLSAECEIQLESVSAAS